MTNRDLAIPPIPDGAMIIHHNKDRRRVEKYPVVPANMFTAADEQHFLPREKVRPVRYEQERAEDAGVTLRKMACWVIAWVVGIVGAFLLACAAFAMLKPVTHIFYIPSGLPTKLGFLAEFGIVTTSAALCATPFVLRLLKRWDSVLAYR